LVIYDILGRQVKQLVNEQMAAGRHSVVWDATDDQGQRVAAGLYFCRMEAEGIARQIKLVLVK
jgi:flagellar hook assembly protein FlgD